jgi:murein DD-endopeptidase MepM/ murein hydrolase activator NlpD
MKMTARTSSCIFWLVLVGILLPSPLSLPVAMAQDAPCGGGRVKGESIDRFTKCAMGRFRKCNADQAVARGLFETGLRPVFPAGLTCRRIDEGYAIDYAGKRNRQVYHGGIDMPAPRGTPIIAAAAGTVVGKFRGEHSFRGIEIVLRHCPEDTGIPLWIYSQYSHFSKMPKLEIGQRVRMGEVLGPTGNTGIGRHGRQSRRRRPAIHFGVFYSTSDKYAVIRDRVIPVDGRWMDPVALFRHALPLDTDAMKSLPEAEKQVPIAVMLAGGKVIPENARIVWPYMCTHR